MKYINMHPYTHYVALVQTAMRSWWNISLFKAANGRKENSWEKSSKMNLMLNKLRWKNKNKYCSFVWILKRNLEFIVFVDFAFRCCCVCVCVLLATIDALNWWAQCITWTVSVCVCMANSGLSGLSVCLVRSAHTVAAVVANRIITRGLIECTE